MDSESEKEMIMRVISSFSDGEGIGCFLFSSVFLVIVSRFLDRFF